MQLIIADDIDHIQISRQLFDLWSSGLSKEHYKYFFWQNHNTAWAKRNIYRLAFKNRNEIVCTCKITKLDLTKRNHIHNIWGLGALFTALNWRNKGLAKKLIKTIIDQAKTKNINGILLFSEINPDFYASLGFKRLGNLDFEINPKFHTQEKNIEKTEITIETRSSNGIATGNKYNSITFKPWLSSDEFVEILRCHKRWLARQPYGIQRNGPYFSAQLNKLLYLNHSSQTSKRSLHMTLAKDANGRIIGYALTTYSGNALRIFEIIGNSEARTELWQFLLSEANRLDILKMTGTEALMKDFIPPDNLDFSDGKNFLSLKAKNIQAYERLLSQPMFLPLHPDLEDLHINNPCPLLELDYF